MSSAWYRNLVGVRMTDDSVSGRWQGHGRFFFLLFLSSFSPAFSLAFLTIYPNVSRQHNLFCILLTSILLKSMKPCYPQRWLLNPGVSLILATRCRAWLCGAFSASWRLSPNGAFRAPVLQATQNLRPSIISRAPVPFRTPNTPHPKTRPELAGRKEKKKG